MSLSKTSKAVVILGPTSSGKSSLAVKIAQEFKGEIISVDSRQVFKGMDLGTGKVEGEWQKPSVRQISSSKPPRLDPFTNAVNSSRCSLFPRTLPEHSTSETDKEKVYMYKGISHHLIDFVEPDEDYNVSHFKKDCEEKILEIIKRGKIPILCGGTGFWIQAVVDDVEFPQIKPDLKLRKKLKEKTNSELLEILKKLDSDRANNIDQKNQARLIRAIEIAEKIGKVPKIKIERKSSTRKIENETIEFLQIGIPVNQYKLVEKIKLRLGERFNQGMVEEILDLFEKYNLSTEKIQNLGIAYSLVPLYRDEGISRKELFDQIVQAEKKYAKRQMTWFKKDPRIFWSEEGDEILNKIKEFLKA